MQRKIKNILPSFLIFFSWMLIFTIEILGARIIWPYIWSSLYLWTSIIAVILFFLSIGSIFWWKLADKYEFHKLITYVFLGITFSCFFLLVTDTFIAKTVISLDFGSRMSSLILSSILFGPITFLLACVFPIVAKKCVVDLQTDGSVLGRLSMISTYGSLLGIGMSIFILIPYLKLDGTIFLLTVLSSIVVVIFSTQKYKIISLFIICLLCLLWFLVWEKKWNINRGILSFDTLYSRINIIDENIFGWFYRLFIVDTRILSEYNLETQDLTPYVEQNFYVFSAFLKEFKNVLMLGGAGYTFPTEFIQLYPDAHIDVVEIDAQMKDIAEEYFFLKDHPNLNIIHNDARYYLNTSPKKYDAIFWDAYSGLRTVPYQLTTREAIQKKYDLLRDDGVVVENVISSLSWETSLYLQTQYNWFQEIFDEVYLYSSYSPEDIESIQNIFLVALKGNAKKGTWETYAQELLWREVFLVPEANLILTDDYAPVEQITAPMNKIIRQNSINTKY